MGRANLIEWFEVKDGDEICIRQGYTREDDEDDDEDGFDEVLMTREVALELAHILIETLE